MHGTNVVLAKLVISEIEKKNLYVKNTEWEYKGWGRLKKNEVKRYVAELFKV